MYNKRSHKQPTGEMIMVAIVDFENPDANMYGCLPCPKCSSKHRASYKGGRKDGTTEIRCDRCGFSEEARIIEL